jgi:hypothetical protein
MPLVLGERHTTLEARTGAELDALLLAWKEKMRGELARWQESPAGIPTPISGCSGPKTLLLRPSWLPNSSVEPGNVLLDFGVRYSSTEGRLVAQVVATISDRSRREPHRA